jgi:hypothetical protein
MDTIFVAYNGITEQFIPCKFAETARDIVFEWAKAKLMAEVPNGEEITVEDLYEEANETVIQAEEAPWLCPFSITEMIVRE